jgi:hypothetical protein
MCEPTNDRPGDVDGPPDAIHGPPDAAHEPLPKNAETLYMLLRENLLCPEDIISFFDLPPSRFLRMLHGKRLQKKLAMEDELADELIRQHRRSRMTAVAERLTALTESRSSETARKVCMSLLRGTAGRRPGRKGRSRSGTTASRRPRRGRNRHRLTIDNVTRALARAQGK